MTISILLKKYASLGMHSTGFNRFIVRNNYNNKTLILAYHRMIDEEDSIQYIQEGMYANVDVFEKQLLFLKKFFQVFDINQIPNLINNINASNDIDKRSFCVLTHGCPNVEGIRSE